ncbi:MAG: NAD(P)/FAD-dependent oxidoreductase [Thermoplasmata archaeon]
MNKVIIIGAGITGSSIARVLSRYKDLEVSLIEKEIDVGWGATKANTGIIHPGHEDDPEKYPLRAELCVKGNKIWHEWAEDLDIPVIWPGELMLASDEEELEICKKYKEIGERNGVSGLKIVEREELEDLEPMVSDDSKYALWAPTAGVIEPWEAVIGVVENAVDNGVNIHLNTEVQDITVENDRVRAVMTDKGKIEADIVINSAGLFADEISSMVAVNEIDIKPRKGQYYIFDEDVEEKPSKILHPTPTEKTKGVYAVQSGEGNLMLGPTAEDLPKEHKDERSTSEDGLDFIWENSKDLLRELPEKDRVSKTFAGLRPEPPKGNYIISSYDEVHGFVNAAGIRSPGLTAAPAIAKKVRDILRDDLGIDLIEDKDWDPKREGITRFSEQSDKKKERLIEKYSDYGRVICMCKEVTKAEILEAVERKKRLGDEVSLDSVKFRTLALFGFCQGSYCRAKIAEILSEELDVAIWDIDVRGKGTEYGIGDVKALQDEGECG